MGRSGKYIRLHAGSSCGRGLRALPAYIRTERSQRLIQRAGEMRIRGSDSRHVHRITLGLRRCLDLG